MTPAETNWTPALAALAIGVVLGIALLWRVAARLAERDHPTPVADARLGATQPSRACGRLTNSRLANTPRNSRKSVADWSSRRRAR